LGTRHVTAKPQDSSARQISHPGSVGRFKGNFQLVNIEKPANGHVEVVMLADNQSRPITMCISSRAITEDKKPYGGVSETLRLPEGSHQIITLKVARSYAAKDILPHVFFVKVTACDQHTLYSWTFMNEHGQIKLLTPIEYIEYFDALFNAAGVFERDLKNSDYADLTKLLEQLNSQKAADLDGYPVLDKFRRALNQFANDQNDMLSGLKIMSQWRSQKPHSAAAAISEAIYLTHYAWYLRGGRYSGANDAFTLKIFNKRMQQAADILESSRAYASSNPLWYDTYLRIAVDLNKPFDFINGLYKAGSQKFSYYTPLHVDMAGYYAPKPPNTSRRKSDWESVDKIVKQAVTSNIAFNGVSEYARIYMHIDFERDTSFKLLRDSRASWKEFRDSFLDLIKRYPAIDNYNRLASYACQAGDKNTYLQMELKIDGKYHNNAWLPNYTRDVCDHKFLTGT